MKTFPKLLVHLRPCLEKWTKNRRANGTIHKSKTNLNSLKKLLNVDNQHFNISNSRDMPQNDSDALLSSTLENPLPPCSRTTVDSNFNPYQIVGGFMIGISDRVEIGSKAFRGKDVKKRKKRICAWCSNDHVSTRENFKGRGRFKHCEHESN